MPQFHAMFLETAERVSAEPLSDLARGYLEACEFTSNDYDQEPSEWEAAEGWAPQAVEHAKAMCKAFSDRAGADYTTALEHIDESQIGRDIWYCSAGHGVGFTDRDELPGDLAERLDALASSFRQVDAYVGDDGKLYLS